MLQLKLSLCLVAVALMLSLTGGSAVAADATTGTIKGTVSGVDGMPAADVKVRLMPKPAKAPKAAEANADAAKTEKLAKGDKAATKAERKAAKQAGGKAKPIAQATTDANGAFTMADVAPGDYVVVAGGKGLGNGRRPVTVSAGGEVTVTIKLKEKKPKA